MRKPVGLSLRPAVLRLPGSRYAMGIQWGWVSETSRAGAANRTQRAGQAAIFPSVQMSSGHWAKWQMSDPLSTMTRKG